MLNILVLIMNTAADFMMLADSWEDIQDIYTTMAEADTVSSLHLVIYLFGILAVICTLI